MNFLLTKELGRLAKWLRIMGFDAEYYRGDNSGSLVIQALREERIIISRNHRLPKQSGARIIFLNAEKIKAQLIEVLKALRLELDSGKMFTRCILCNKQLQLISKEEIKDKVPAYVFGTQQAFNRCPQCRRVYWAGTHWGNAREILETLGVG